MPVDVEPDDAPLKDPAALADVADGDPYHQDSLIAQQSFDEAVAAASDGQEDLAVAHYLKAARLAERAAEWYLAAVCCHRVGDFLLNPRPPYDLERGLRMYRRAVAAYDRCGHFSEARRLSYRLTYLRLHRAKELKISRLDQLEMQLFWVLSGFGHRPLRVIVTALCLIFLYALVYWTFGGVIAAQGHEQAGFWESIYFSGVTFATVGYGDFIPTPHMRIVALSEGLVGSFTMSFFVVVLANRLRQ